MCSPTALIAGASAAATLGGTYYNNKQQQEYYDAVDAQNQRAYERSEKMRRLEQQRQQAMREQRRNTFFEGVMAADPGKQREQLDATQAANMGELEAARVLQTPGWLDGAGTGASGGEQSGRANRVVADNSGQLNAQARLRAGDANLPNINLSLGRLGSELGFLDQNMRGSVGVAQQEQAIGPAQVRPDNGMLGDALLAGGGLGLQYAGSMAGKNSLGGKGSSGKPLQKAAPGYGGLY